MWRLTRKEKQNLQTVGYVLSCEYVQFLAHENKLKKLEVTEDSRTCTVYFKIQRGSLYGVYKFIKSIELIRPAWSRYDYGKYEYIKEIINKGVINYGNTKMQELWSRFLPKTKKPGEL